MFTKSVTLVGAHSTVRCWEAARREAGKVGSRGSRLLASGWVKFDGHSGTFWDIAVMGCGGSWSVGSCWDKGGGVMKFDGHSGTFWDIAVLGCGRSWSVGSCCHKGGGRKF